MFERSQVAVLLDRVKAPAMRILVLTGPRQCGKTTAVGQFIDKCGLPCFFFSADNVKTVNNDWIVEQWESVRNRMDAEERTEAVLVIDEVQKIRNWSEAVKGEWDYDRRTGRKLRVILLGSSRLLLQKGLEESLAGRFEKIDMTFWSFDEMHEAFGMTRDEYIYFGGFPGLHDAVSDEERWRQLMETSIVLPFLQRDLAEIDAIRNPSLMANVFSLGSAMSGREVSVNKLQSELNNGSNPTVTNYLDILDKTMLLKPIYKYRPSVLDKYKSVPKMQVYNNGFLSLGNNVRFSDVRKDPARWGQWVESAVGAHLLNMAAVYGYEVFYWRETRMYKNRQGKAQKGIFEVDFVLKKGNSVVAIEVKSGRTDSLSGLSEFRKEFSEGGVEQLTSALVVGNQGLTFEEFCRMNLGKLFLDKKTVPPESRTSVSLSRLDKGQKEQLELIGRVEGVVWMDGEEYLIQKMPDGSVGRMRSAEAYELLCRTVPEVLATLGIAQPAILKELAAGRTLSVGKERLYFDIASRSVKEGETYVEALLSRIGKTALT